MSGGTHFCGCQHHCCASWSRGSRTPLFADGSLLYVGRDKYENEELIRWGWPEDVWFHVDNISSPHVYVRMPPVRVPRTPTASLPGVIACVRPHLVC
ncbi:DUF814 domain-containing protein [archaeon]|nr:MAG: DUF814 domain-containing protein [archaeon]